MRIAHLESDGVGLVLEIPDAGLPRVLHWGAALGPLGDDELAALADGVSRQSAGGTLDAAWQPSVLPQEGDGWSGRPGIQTRIDGVLHHPRWADATVAAGAPHRSSSSAAGAPHRSSSSAAGAPHRSSSSAAGAYRDAVSTPAPGLDTAASRPTRPTGPAPAELRIGADDAASGLHLELRYAIEHGVLWASAALENRGPHPVDVDWLELALPVPSTATHLTSFDGRWTREKRPVTTGVPAGSTVRQSRRGRPGHDAPTAFLLGIGEPSWRHGELWAVHLAWPSDVSYRLDRITDQPTLLGAGEHLRPGEIALLPGERYESPRAAFVYSPAGLDGVAARFHAWMRARHRHPSTPRPLTLNTWEAVYFDHDPARLTALAERAADLGVERFVLDDGWFAGRRDDTTSLGDWTVDRSVWPDGLGPLAARVHELGMQFGLWFEPEMVSLDSELARAHPEWMLHDPGHLRHDPELSWRNQYVLDLAEPGAYAHILGQIDALIRELGIDYIKWDHNRDLVESVHAGRPGGHAQTLAVLGLMRELRARHPALEIESCSSGGARTDLGILDVTDRVWASDSNDPVERQDIQRWTGLLLPPELIGAHVGPSPAHSSGRATDLSYRMATSLMGSAGFEWDLLAATDAEATAIRAFAALYRELRPVVHGGAVVHPELRDAAWRVTGYLRADAPGACAPGGAGADPASVAEAVSVGDAAVASSVAEAVFVVATVASLEDARAERLRLPGLDPARRYRVRVRREIGEARCGWIAPEWFTRGEITQPGAVLGRVGLQLPTLWPVQAFVLHLVADPLVE